MWKCLRKGNRHNYIERSYRSDSHLPEHGECVAVSIANVSSSADGFCTKDESGEWDCWDLEEMQIWVAEGWLDRRNWTSIDRQGYTEHLNTRAWHKTCVISSFDPGEIPFQPGD